MMRTVVPIGRNETLLVGAGPAVCSGDELEDVALAFAEDVGDDAVADEAGPELDDDEAVPWVVAPVAAPVVDVEFDDPPHAVSSSSSEPSPAATVHPPLRITSLSLTGPPGARGSYAVCRGLTYPK